MDLFKKKVKNEQSQKDQSQKQDYSQKQNTEESELKTEDIVTNNKKYMQNLNDFITEKFKKQVEDEQDH